MNSRMVAVLVLAVLAGCWDASVISWFDSPFSAMRLSLAFSVLLTLFSSGYGKSVSVALVSGAVADLLLPSDGWMAIRMMLAVIVVHTLARHVFTNRSIWGICFLGSIAVATDRVLLWLIERVPTIHGLMRTLEVRASFWMEILWMCFVCTLAFVLIAAFSRRFHPTLSRMDRMNRLPWG